MFLNAVQNCPFFFYLQNELWSRVNRVLKKRDEDVSRYFLLILPPVMIYTMRGLWGDARKYRSKNTFRVRYELNFSGVDTFRFELIFLLN